MKWHTDPTLYDRCCGDRPTVYVLNTVYAPPRRPVRQYIAYCGACGDEVSRSTPLATLIAWNKAKRKEAKV